MTEKRLKTHRESGMSYENIAKMEVTMGIAFLSNTIPSIFWVLFDVFSRPQLLAELREEITQGALHIESSNNDLPNQSKTTHTLDMNSLRDNCPLLLATWQETLRLRANVAAVRLVYKDTIINDNYLLKAGSLVQMPSNVLNLDPQTWGNDAFDYNPTRFLGSNDIGTTKRESKRNGFLTFGTSPWTCPGRHFATAEALALISMFVMRFDFTPVSGVWKSPEVNETKMALSVPPPAGELMVNIVPRQGTKGESWEFKALKGKTKFSLVTG